MTRERPTALLLDLDGVLRRFDPAVGADVEQRYGLPKGALLDTALRWPLLQPAITGRITHAQWLEAIAVELAGVADGAAGAEAGGAAGDGVAGAGVGGTAGAGVGGVAGDLEAARKAVAEWAAHRGSVDQDVLAFVREVRAAGRKVGLATNSTDALDADLVGLGLTGEFDAVINSSAVGAHKPTKEYFAQACLAVGAPPAQVLFVDDEDRQVRGARVAGLSAYRWNGLQDLRYLRAALAL